jgi:hypothetical protein
MELKMGVTTPNIGIYIPVAGETNYDQSFAAGMVNIDLHDHSGGPNKGVPIGSSSIADGAITFNLLNPNVADTTTGIGTSLLNPNQLQILGILQSIYKIATPNGFIAKNGSLANALTFQNSSTIVWTNPDGSTGNPSAALVSTLTTSVTGTANQIDASAAVAGVQTLSLDPNFFATGTFTPTINTSNSNIGAITYSTQVGTYQKIGKWVIVSLTLIFTASSGTGNLVIGGLPIPSIATNWFAGYMSSASLTPNQQVVSYSSSGSTVLIFPNGAATSQLTVPVSSPYGFNMQLTGLYQWSA